MIFIVESLSCYHFHILVGIFHYRTWLVYSNDGLPQNCPRSSWASNLDAHPLSFFLRFHILIALVHPLHGNPYSLTLISIDGHLHSPLIRLVDVRPSSPSCLLHNHHSIPPIVLYPWLTLMYCVKIEKVRVWNNCLACHRGCAWFKYFVWWRWSIARLYDFVGITFFGHVILRRHNCFVSMLEVFFYVNINFCLESF